MIKSGKYNLWKYGELLESINESPDKGGTSIEDLENDAERVVPDWLNLGLPSGLKWAKCNLGADKETDYGDYYMWGSVTPNEKCVWSICPWGTERPPMSTLDAEHDAAQVAGIGRMPTKADFKELLANTTNKWVEDYNGSRVNGCLFTAANGNSIFIPASGYRVADDFSHQGNRAFVWSSSLFTPDPTCAWYSGFPNDYGCRPRAFGYPIRPVIGGSLKESSDKGGTSIEELENDADVLDINQQLFLLFENHLNKYPIGISKFGDNYQTLDLFIPPKPKKGDEGFVDIARFLMYIYNENEYERMLSYPSWLLRQDNHHQGGRISKQQIIKNFTFHIEEDFTKKGELKDCLYLNHLSWKPNFPNPKITCFFAVWSSRPGRSKYKYREIYLEDLDKDLQKRIVNFVKEKLEKDAVFLNQYLK